jgi:SAM-dependent methyltransferase
MSGPAHDFWESRFASGSIPWDRGTANPQLSAWLADGTLVPGSSILVPGCGQGWEVAALAAAGLQVTGLDYSPAALTLCRQILQHEKTNAELIEANVLHWQPAAPFDVIFEQTCLCALYPDFWVHYANQLHTWLKPGGKLLAMFLQTLRPDSAHGLIEGPPYHCDINAMRALFPATHWDWPAPPYPQVKQTGGLGLIELAVVLQRK